jgi:hypothetical protein
VPDIPLRLDADPQWQAIHAAADAQQGALARLVYSLFVGLTVRGVLGRLRAAIRAADIERAVAAVPIETILEAAPAVEEILLRAATGGALVASERHIPLETLRAMEAEIRVALGSARGLPVDALVQWSRTHAAELVTNLSTETRRALRDVLTQAIHQGQAPARTARIVESVIGLTRQQANAVARFYAANREAGVPLLRLNQLTQRYAARLLRHRALVIARTEALKAANEGRRQQWEREAREGLIDRSRWEQEWVAIVPSDGRTCPACEELDGARAPIGGSFPDPGGAGPPQHPICRCTTNLVRAA